MTLIARFDSFDTPILMGDFLISATNRPAGLKKKICRIGSNLAIGWTGHRLAAEIVIKQLDQYCCEHKISQSTLEEFFTTFNTADLCQLSVHIIGWLITDTENCPFLWNSEYPGELFYDHPIFDGTGADVVAQQVGSGFRGNFTDHTPLPDMPLTATLRVATELMKDEITDKINQTMGFGHAYEILYWNGERWEYLDNIAYLVITIRLNEQEIAESYEITGSIYKYSTHGEFAVTEHFRLKDNHHHISIITPPTVFDVNIVRNLRKKLPIQEGKFPIRSQYYCIFMVFESETETVTFPPFSLICDPGFPGVHIDDHGNLMISLKLDYLTSIYKTISTRYKEFIKHTS